MVVFPTPRALAALMLSCCLAAAPAAARTAISGEGIHVRSRLEKSPFRDSWYRPYTNRRMYGGGFGMLRSVLPWMEDPEAQAIFASPIVMGDQLEITSDCPRTVYLSVFACGDAGCAERVHGKLPSKLAADGWARSTEGVHFTADSTGDYLHGTHMYGKDVAAGETVATPVLAEHAFYVGIFATPCKADDAGAGSVGSGSGGVVADGSGNDGAGTGNVGPSRPQCADHCPEVPHVVVTCRNGWSDGWHQSEIDERCEALLWSGCEGKRETEFEAEDGGKVMAGEVCCVCGGGETSYTPMGFDQGESVMLATFHQVRARRGELFAHGSRRDLWEHAVAQFFGRGCELRWVEFNVPCSGSRATISAQIDGSWQTLQDACGSMLPPTIKVEHESFTVSLDMTYDTARDTVISLEWACDDVWYKTW